MRIDVTFAQTDIEMRPVFDVVIPIDTGAVSVQAFLDGSISGRYVSDKIIRLRTGAFCNCENLTYVSFPNCTKLDGFRQFSECSKLTAINLPKLETITDGNQNFTYLNVNEISLPSLTKITSSNATFTNCKYVRKISMPLLSGSTLGANCFNNNYSLHTLILGGDTLNPLGNTSAFKNAGSQTSGGFRVYVPDNLVDAYKTATNWTAFADKIKPMSELEE